MNKTVDPAQVIGARPLPPKKQKKQKAASLFGLMRGPIIVGAIITLAFFGVFGTWAALAPLSAGAIAQGVVSPASSLKVIQHLEGGIVETIHVKEGQHVKAGDPLVTLQPDRAEATVNAGRAQWLRLLVVRARLEAQARGLDAIPLPQQVSNITDTDLLAFISNQQRLFDTQNRSQLQRSQIADRQADQLRSQIASLQAETAGMQAQLTIVDEQIKNNLSLLDQQLVAKSQVTDMQRMQAQLRSEMAANDAKVGSANQSIEESKLTLLQADEDFRIKIADEMTQTNNQVAVTEADIANNADILARTVITSPVDGVVLNLHTQTVGGIVRPGDTLMDVVPLDDDLIVLAKLAPKDIDIVSVGLKAHVTLTPFASRNVLPLIGEVTQIAADSTLDELTHTSFYEVRVRVPASEIAKHQGMFMAPGMPADVTIVTGERTMLQYLAEPLLRAIRNAFIYD